MSTVAEHTGSSSGEGAAQGGDFERLLGDTLARVVPGFGRLIEASRLSGGASQETYRIEFEADGERRLLAMRRAAGGTAAEPNPERPGLDTEAALMQIAAAAGVPEPEIVHVLTESDGLGPGFIMQWLEGETLGSRVLRAPELDDVRPRLARECGRILARIHAIDLAATGLDGRLQTVPTDAFVTRMWEEYQAMDTPHPMIDFTARWLLDHTPPAAEHRLVHNDFRNGNLMITPDGVAAVLDWEVAHIGDPVRDLGWICTSSWRFGRAELPVGGFGTREELLAGYEQESGIAVDPEHLRFWEVFGSFWWAVGCLKMAQSWREGPDSTVERPGIARRSSECQADCVNLIIPGPVDLVAGSDGEAAKASSIDTPSVSELLSSVRDFLRHDARSAMEGRNGFMALVASNSLDIVLRELRLTGPHRAAEHDRLRRVLGRDGDLDELRRELCRGLRDRSIALDRSGLADHLRSTTVNQLAIDQPRYPALAQALGSSPRPRGEV